MWTKMKRKKEYENIKIKDFPAHKIDYCLVRRFGSCKHFLLMNFCSTKGSWFSFHKAKSKINSSLRTFEFEYKGTRTLSTASNIG